MAAYQNMSCENQSRNAHFSTGLAGRAPSNAGPPPKQQKWVLCCRVPMAIGQ
jgi:hypothetical protein